MRLWSRPHFRRDSTRLWDRAAAPREPTLFYIYMAGLWGYGAPSDGLACTLCDEGSFSTGFAAECSLGDKTRFQDQTGADVCPLCTDRETTTEMGSAACHCAPG